MKSEKLDSKKRAARFVSDLAGVAGPKRFYRVFLRHWDFFDDLLKDGECWRSIADLLTKAGARNRRGQDISDALLREYNSRRKRQAAKTVSDAAHEEMRIESGVAKAQLARRYASGPKTAALEKDVDVGGRKNAERTIGTSRIDQRLKMMTKTRHGKRLDLDE